MKLVAYANNLVIFMLGMFSSVMNEVMEDALRKVYVSAARLGTQCGADAFYYQDKGIRVPPPRLAYSSHVKYLDVIVDPYLS